MNAQQPNLFLKYGQQTKRVTKTLYDILCLLNSIFVVLQSTASKFFCPLTILVKYAPLQNDK